MPDSLVSVLILCISFWVEDIDKRPGVFGWLIRRRLGHLEEVEEVFNVLLRELTVGVYDEITKSETHCPG